MKKPNAKMIFFNNLPRYLNLKFIFSLVLIGLIFFNSFQLFNKIQKLQKQRKFYPYTFLGNKFAGLNELFENIQYIGYYTDKDLDNNKNAAQFSQAQYTLTPIILDLNYLEHEYILFDCSSIKKAQEKIKEIKAIPIKANKFGIILAKRQK